MTDDFGAEYARAIWQSQESQVPALSMDDVETRTTFLREQFRKSWLVPWGLAAFLILFFLTMLLAVARTGVQRAGAVTGIASGVVMAAGAVWWRRRSEAGSADTGLAAYRVQLETQRTALHLSMVAMALMMTGAAALGAPDPWDAAQAAWNAAGPLVGAAASIWYVGRQARSYRRRIADVARLERGS
jgi:hypothetical protein